VFDIAVAQALAHSPVHRKPYRSTRQRLAIAVSEATVFLWKDKGLCLTLRHDVRIKALCIVRHRNCYRQSPYGDIGGDMNPVAPLVGSQKSDPQVVKQWAAEDFAISIGLLRECPYHGQPFKAKPPRWSGSKLPRALIDPLDPAVRAFNGDTRELMAAVEDVTGHYGDRCEYCEASEKEVFD
jgi:hypothetical protein